MPQPAMGAECCGLGGLRGRAPRLGQTWEVAAWEIAHLRNSHLGKIHLGSMPLGTWEKPFGKVPNIDIYIYISTYIYVCKDVCIMYMNV